MTLRVDNIDVVSKLKIKWIGNGSPFSEQEPFKATTNISIDGVLEEDIFAHKSIRELLINQTGIVIENEDVDIESIEVDSYVNEQYMGSYNMYRNNCFMKDEFGSYWIQAMIALSEYY